MSLLEIDAINTYYGEAHVLFDISLHVEQNEVVALLGRNGAGKTTTLKTIMGVLAPQSGAIRVNGEPVQGLAPYQIARRGVQLVPEERRIIGALTVEENLELAALSAPQRWSLSRIYQIFPRFGERRKNHGNELSGGEQQMLAIARALIRDAKLILLDEPFEGLAPLIVRDLLKVCRLLADEGRTIIIVEQNVAAALSLAQRCVWRNNGHRGGGGTGAALKADPDIMQTHLGI